MESLSSESNCYWLRIIVDPLFITPSKAWESILYSGFYVYSKHSFESPNKNFAEYSAYM